MRLYSELAPWFHLLTHPSDYEEEADFITRILDATVRGRARTLLELGSGGGNNALHLRGRFECTLTDLSPEMLEVSRSINPECEHVVGDMRTLRLDRSFDAVLVHDAVMYMTTEEDLGAAIVTATTHLRPGGVAIFTPDTTREQFTPATSHGGHDGEDGRSLRYLQWVTDPTPDDTTYDADLVLLLREPKEPLRVEHDHLVRGLFPAATWHRLIERAGLVLVDPGVEDPFAGEHAVFVARKGA